MTSAASVYCVSVYVGLKSGLEHPYFREYHAALARHGVFSSSDVEIASAWLHAHAGRVDAVHLHWPETVWRGLDQRGSAARALQAGGRLLRLRRFLKTARRLRITTLWTVHNLEPHEGAGRWDRLGYWLIARYTDAIICHSRSAVDGVRRQYRPTGKIVLMPMGPLDAALPAARERGHVLSGLGLDPRLPLVSCLGRLRYYKGLDLACDALARLGGRVQLVIAGAPHGGFDLGPLESAAKGRPEIVLLPRKLLDQEFADLMGASDAALLPYRNVTGSAVLMTALGFGRGVIASDLPYFREVLEGEPDAGLTVSGSDPFRWAAAIESFLARDANARHAAALRLAKRYSWDGSVMAVLDALGTTGQRDLDMERLPEAYGAHHE